ncbi:MAG TPA: ergothioneine biosynthesis protein EgtB [Saprospiraceae bacterium]|nr:ergothioneine biosynthesis protein EgtB [Saprospiraceae bacterium]
MTYNPPTFATADLLRNYQQVRKQSKHICAPLQTEDYTVQPITDVSPPKWHLGHTTWFFENFVLIPQLDQYEPFNLDLNYFFNSYYESQGPRILRSNRGNMTRPSIEQVLAYRVHVDQYMQIFLERQGKLSKELHHLITVGLQHEQQHQELLITDIKYILGDNPLHPAYREDEIAMPSTPEAHFLNFDEGLYEVGYRGEGFCWDNEQNPHQVYLPNFAIQSRLVTNGEYLEFIQAGGYDKHEYWLMEGYEWAKTLESKSPQYWYEQDGQWHYYTMQGLRPLDLDAPVTHISYYEADAYAQWKGLRLPTEFEWEVACRALCKEIPEDGNFQESGSFMPTPARGKDDHQFLGQVWEWTASAYLPYPGYPRFKGALGEYNGKFMVNQMVLRGGSCATPISHIRPTYRNFFHPDKRWQFTGVRLAK